MPQWQQGSLAHIYVIVEDYLNHGYEKKKGYAKYEGAQYSALLNRQICAQRIWSLSRERVTLE